MELFEGEERYLLVCLKSGEDTLSYYWYPNTKRRYERYYNNSLLEIFRTKKELKQHLKTDLFEKYDWNNMKFTWDVEKGESLVGDVLNLNYYSRV